MPNGVTVTSQAKVYVHDWFVESIEKACILKVLEQRSVSYVLFYRFHGLNSIYFIPTIIRETLTRNVRNRSEFFL